MSSLEPVVSDGHYRKRARDEDLSLPEGLPGEGAASVTKRTRPTGQGPEEEQKQWLLEDLYGLDSTQEVTTLEFATQEDLVTEMMRSLEKVISATEDSLLAEPSTSSCSQDLRRSLGRSTPHNLDEFESTAANCAPDDSLLLSDNTSSSTREGDESSESDFDIRYLLEASDDELGIAPSPNSDGELTWENLAQDASWLDGNYAELFNDPEMVSCAELGDEVRANNGRNGWFSIADAYDEVEEAILAERDHYNLLHSEYHLY